MHLFGDLFGLSVAVPITLAAFASLALPLLYVWMLIDAILRNPADYPGGVTSNEKVVWVVAIVFFHVAAAIYFLTVFARKRREAPSVPAGYTAVVPAS
jgi:hypothetical protein